MLRLDYLPAPTDKTYVQLDADVTGPATTGGQLPDGFYVVFGEAGKTNIPDTLVQPDLAALQNLLANRLPGAYGVMDFTTKVNPQFTFDITSISASEFRNPVPAPSTGLLLATGVLGLLYRRRARKGAR